MKVMQQLSFALVLLVATLIFTPQKAVSQPKLKRIYFNLYADSIKTVLHYYVNVEGEYTDGRTLPMDTNSVRIIADRGIMAGNDWIAPAVIDFDKVMFHTYAKDDPRVNDRVTVWLKRFKDPRDEMRFEDMDMPVVPENIRKRRR